MRFWDSSAIVPLLLSEPGRDALLRLLEEDPVVVVWWGSRIECTAAIARREREGALSVSETASTVDRLYRIAGQWQEILPTEIVRTTAERLLRVHPLRTANSLQLAAAVVAAEHEPRSLPFVSLDARLNDAAAREGFPVHEL